MPLTISGEAAQGADRQPRTVSFSLRPQDSSMIEGMKLDQNLSVAISGRITSLNISEYGVSMSMEIDSAGLAIQKPEPAKFVDQVEKMKILKS